MFPLPEVFSSSREAASSVAVAVAPFVVIPQGICVFCYGCPFVCRPAVQLERTYLIPDLDIVIVGSSRLLTMGLGPTHPSQTDDTSTLAGQPATHHAAIHAAKPPHTHTHYNLEETCTA